MNTIEELVVILGMSFDVFAMMECHGSLIAKVEKKRLVAACFLLALGQAAALGIGDSISLRLCENRRGAHEAFLGQVVAATIFLCLGARLFRKAWQKEGILERREDKPNLTETARLYTQTMAFTLLAGLAFGLLQSGRAALLAMVMLLTATGAILGVYTGLHFGFEQRGKAYLAGGTLLAIGGLDVILRYICKIL